MPNRGVREACYNLTVGEFSVAQHPGWLGREDSNFRMVESKNPPSRLKGIEILVTRFR
jgi:hypothetical protein